MYKNLTVTNYSKTLAGDTDQILIHLNGLRQMIALRGDLSSLPLTVVSQVAVLVDPLFSPSSYSPILLQGKS